jgi:hypothetical protein
MTSEAIDARLQALPKAVRLATVAQWTPSYA